MTDTMIGVTEFVELDPDEMHLVPAGANGFPFLLAKSVADALEEQLLADAIKAVDEAEVVKACGLVGCEVCDHAASKAKLDADARNSLSDKDFAYIDSKGGRHLPIHDAAHVRNALARFNQTHFESAEAKAAAHRKIVARAKALGIDVSDTSKAVSTGEALSQTNDNIEGNGTGVDSPEAGDGGTPRSTGAESGAPADGDGEGDTAPDKDTHQSEAEGQTGAIKDDGTPGSPSWEATDAGLAERASGLLTEAKGLTDTLAARERAESTTAKAGALSEETEGAIRQTIEALEKALADNNPPVSKEEIEMNQDELKKELDERDERLVARLTAALKGDATATATTDTAEGGTPDAEAADAAKAAEGAPAAPAGDDEAAKLRETVAKLEERLAKVEEQPGPTPLLNTAGLPGAPGMVAPVHRGDAPAGGEEALKANFDALQKAIDEAPTGPARDAAIDQMAHAKILAATKASLDPAMAARYGDMGRPLVTNRHALPDDLAISYQN